MTFFRALFRHRAVKAEMAEELQAHVHARAEHLVCCGPPPEEATHRSRVEFGSFERYKEGCRELLGVQLVDELKADLRYPVRSIRHNKAFTAAIIGRFALGMRLDDFLKEEGVFEEAQAKAVREVVA